MKTTTSHEPTEQQEKIVQAFIDRIAELQNENSKLKKAIHCFTEDDVMARESIQNEYKTK